jgi:elongator complex protein 5
VHVTIIAFETLKKPDGVDAFVSTRQKSPAEIVKEVAAAYQPTAAAGLSRRELLREHSTSS